MGKDMPRVTTQTLGVLAALTSAAMEQLSGAEIARRTNLKSGTLYPILFRLEEAKWVVSRWEDGDPRELGRPRRRLYQLTGIGEAKAREAFKEVSAMIGGLAWGNSS